MPKYCDFAPQHTQIKPYSIQNHSGVAATQCYRRLQFLMDFLTCFFSFSAPRPYSVKTPLLAHNPNNLFDQIWRKHVPFGTFGPKFLTPTSQPPKFKIFHCKMRLFVKITNLLHSQLHISCTLNKNICHHKILHKSKCS